MKKDAVVYWILGALLFGWGLGALRSGIGWWPPSLLFLGALVFFLPVGLSPKDRAEIFEYPLVWQRPDNDEPLFLARLFAAMSWTARREGLLGLCGLATPQVCSHPIFLRGFNMVIDGMDPEFVKSTIAQGSDSLRCLYEAKRQHFRQLGALLLSVGIFGGLSTAAVFLFRFGEGGAFSAEESISATFLSCLFLMSGMTVFFMIPSRILGEYRREETLRRQITDGLIELQSGDSYSAVLLRQSVFLSPKERKLLKDTPISEELKPYMRRGSYEQAVCDIRSVMANDAK